jgi:D-glycero-D-manno-heptose 1,7-bisphosphate phosphatase
VAPPCLFLDRDGVVNVEIGYLHKIPDVQWMPGITSLIRTARAHGMKVAIVTNQAGIARGMYTEEQFHELMVWMRAELDREQADVDAVYYCAHHPVHGVGEYKRECDERKPGPGMLLRGERELGIDLSTSILVGDRCSDLAAGHAAGIKQVFLIRGTEEAGCGEPHTAIESLDEVERWIAERYQKV